MIIAVSLSILAVALITEAALGYPARLFSAVGHPVTWIGRLIRCLDAHLNRETLPGVARRRAGIVALLILLGASAAVAAALTALAFTAGRVAGILACGILASSLLASRSLYEHVAAVAAGLRDSGLDGGRHAVSMIVGRNPAFLDEAGVCRAAIESLAENFADGVVAPAFWTGLAGLPGGVLYKAANTADSMIGHKNERYRDFGWAAARFDDLINLPASRLTGGLIVLAAALTPGADAGVAWRCMRRDAPRHRSPNAGWPEAAMAGALGLKLNGPRVYGETRVEDAYMGEGRTQATPADIDRALVLYQRALWLQAGLVAGLTALAWALALS